MDNEMLKHYGVLGMKWGRRRYQNKDGTLTDVGKKRYDRDQEENAAKKKDNRIDVSKPDPRRWVKEDTERTKKIVDTSSEFVRQAKKIDQESRPKPEKKKMDLSKMSDKEMRDRINRELLERQYNNLFAEESTPQISKGRQYISNILDVAGSTLAVGSSALGIALAIKELRG